MQQKKKKNPKKWYAGAPEHDKDSLSKMFIRFEKNGRKPYYVNEDYLLRFSFDWGNNRWKNYSKRIKSVGIEGLKRLLEDYLQKYDIKYAFIADSEFNAKPQEHYIKELGRWVTSEKNKSTQQLSAKYEELKTSKKRSLFSCWICYTNLEQIERIQKGKPKNETIFSKENLALSEMSDSVRVYHAIETLKKEYKNRNTKNIARAWVMRFSDNERVGIISNGEFIAQNEELKAILEEVNQAHYEAEVEETELPQNLTLSPV